MARSPKRDPLCPICQKPIRATDEVVRRGSDLVHARCDPGRKKR